MLGYIDRAARGARLLTVSGQSNVTVNKKLLKKKVWSLGLRYISPTFTVSEIERHGGDVEGVVVAIPYR